MIEIIQQRLNDYLAPNPLAEEQALKEILQEVALYGLWRADFFKIAAFQGGTSLRILHQLPRFSEDLDFILKTEIADFAWGGYLSSLRETISEFGFEVDIRDKGKMDRQIQQAVLKDNSLASQLNISFSSFERRPALKIKLEVDIKPPANSGFSWSYLDFPLDFEICHQDLASNFALKIHALLCRPYLKGRDWFDFSWYVGRKIGPNLQHLQAALQQHGPWKNQNIQLTSAWLQHELKDKIFTVDWHEAAGDVERFLDVTQRKSLSLWSEDFFVHKVSKLAV